MIKSESKGSIEDRQLFRIFFYVFSQYLPNPPLQKTALLLVAQTLHYTPFDLQNYYSSEIYRYFVGILRREGRQFTRKESYLNNKLVKIFIRIGK
jgi:hypothetical protein